MTATGHEAALIARAERIADYVYTRDHGGKWERFRDFVIGVLREQRADDVGALVEIEHAGSVR
jgi:hypothetical protein